MELKYLNEPNISLPVLNGRLLRFPSVFTDSLFQREQTWLAKNEQVAIEEIRKHCPELFSFGTTITTILNSSISAIIIRDFLDDDWDVSKSRLVFHSFILGLGLTSLHTMDANSVVWDIKPRNDNKDRFRTFSQHNLPAPLHTDSQYSELPEKYIALLTYQSASCGGGKSQFLNGHHVIQQLFASEEGKQIFECLSRIKVPYLIPPVFHQQGKPNYRLATVFSPNILIRYRQDTLEQGFKQADHQYNSNVLDAVQRLGELILNSNFAIDFTLENGDMLIVNNHTSLHARTGFEDSNRLLFRIRFNDFPQVTA